MARRFCFQLSTLKLLRCVQPGGATTSSASMASLSGSGRDTIGGKARPRAGGGEGDEDDASAARGCSAARPAAGRARTKGGPWAGGPRWCCASRCWREAAAPPAQVQPPGPAPLPGPRGGRGGSLEAPPRAHAIGRPLAFVTSGGGGWLSASSVWLGTASRFRSPAVKWEEGRRWGPGTGSSQPSFAAKRRSDEPIRRPGPRTPDPVRRALGGLRAEGVPDPRAASVVGAAPACRAEAGGTLPPELAAPSAVRTAGQPQFSHWF